MAPEPRCDHFDTQRCILWSGHPGDHERRARGINACYETHPFAGALAPMCERVKGHSGPHCADHLDTAHVWASTAPARQPDADGEQERIIALMLEVGQARRRLAEVEVQWAQVTKRDRERAALALLERIRSGE